MTQHPLSQSLAEGNKSDVAVYKKDRRCKRASCRKPLSIYNPGPWCNVDMEYGSDLEYRKSEDCRLDIVNRQKVRQNKDYKRVKKEGV